MSNENVETGKILGSIYGSLIIFLAVLLFMSSIFAGLTVDEFRMRSFFLIFFVGAMIVVIGGELARILQRSGITIVGFIAFLLLNLLMVIIALALFSDIVVLDPLAIQNTLFLAIAGGAWYLVLVLLYLRDWRKSR